MLPIELTDVIFMLVIACSGRSMRVACRTMRDFVDARVRSFAVNAVQADKKRAMARQVCLKQLTSALDRFRGLNKLTIGNRENKGVRKCLERGVLANLLSAIPGGVRDITIHCCRLDAAARIALAKCCGQGTRLHVEVDIRRGESVRDQLERQVGRLCEPLRSLRLVNDASTPYVPTDFGFLSKFTALEVLSMPGQYPRDLKFLTRLTDLAVYKCDDTTGLPASLKTIELCDPGLPYRPPKFLPDHVFLKARVMIDDNIGLNLNMLAVVKRLRYWQERGARGLLDLDLRMKLTTKLHFIAAWFRHMEYAACISQLQIEKANVFKAEVMAPFSLPNIKELRLAGAFEVGAMETIADVKKVMPHCNLTIERRGNVRSMTGEPFGKACRDLIARMDRTPPLTLVVNGQRHVYPVEELLRMHEGGVLLADGKPAIKGRYI